MRGDWSGLQSALIFLQHRLQRRLVEPGQGLGGGGGGVAHRQTDLRLPLHPPVAAVPPGVVPVRKVDVETRGTAGCSPPLYRRPWTS